MNTFSDELRKERVAKNISLADIATKTHINVKYLEAIEQGSFDVLPQTYVRAFIREYAMMVGLSPAEVLNKFDIMVSGKYSIGKGALIGSGWSGTTLPSLPEQVPAPEGRVRQDAIQSNDTRKLVVGIAVTFLALILIYFIYDYATQEGKAPVALETPFQEIVKEQEKQIQPQKAALDSFAALQAAPKKDSLTLRGVAIDSVWISISTDNAPSQSLLLPPRSSRTWVAVKNFTVTLGNAGGIRFTLNGTDIGALGKRGAVLRNIALTSDYLKSKQ